MLPDEICRRLGEPKVRSIFHELTADAMKKVLKGGELSSKSQQVSTKRRNEEWAGKVWRSISEQRLFPAINLAASGTRKEHLLMTEQELKTVTALRRRLMNMKPPQQIEQLLAALKRVPTNEELVRG